jgi:hypothetical protein
LLDEDVVVNEEVTGEDQITRRDGNTKLSRNLEDNNHHPSVAYTTDQKWTIALLKVLDDMRNAPDYAFKSMVEWARDACADGYSFQAVTGGVARSKNVDALINSVHNGRLALPSVLTVNCPHPPYSDVICFDFVPQTW